MQQLTPTGLPLRMSREISTEEARKVYARMETSGIGADAPDFYIARARFEAGLGNRLRAEGILQGAIDAGQIEAKPVLSVLESLRCVPLQPNAGTTPSLRGVPMQTLGIEQDDTVEMPAKGRRVWMELPDTQKLSLRPPPDILPEALTQKISLSAPPSSMPEALTPDLPNTVKVQHEPSRMATAADALLARTDKLVKTPPANRASAAPITASTAPFARSASVDSACKRAPVPRRLGLTRLGLGGGAKRVVAGEGDTDSPNAHPAESAVPTTRELASSSRESDGHECDGPLDDTSPGSILMPPLGAIEEAEEPPMSATGAATASARPGLDDTALLLQPHAAAAATTPRIAGAELEDTVPLPNLGAPGTLVPELEDTAPMAYLRAGPMAAPTADTPARIAPLTPLVGARVRPPLAPTSVGPPGSSVQVRMRPPPASQSHGGGLSERAFALPSHTPARAPLTPVPMTPIRSIVAPHTTHRPPAAPSGVVAMACATPGAVAGADVISVNGVPYSKLDTIGRGGTSQVFRVLSPDRKILALKQVKFDSDPGLLEAVVNEIELMKLLRERKLNQVIIELFDSEVKMEEETVYMVMECGEIDLAHMLQRQRGTERDGTLSESFICMYWQQMLTAVHAIHEARVIHADLKPANFLCVQGALKLIDFGIAKQSSADTTKIARDSQVGTVNYMSPESITCDAEDTSSDGQFKLGRASDVWSLGCILYQMVYGHTPFSHLRTIYQKLSAIPDATKPIAFPPTRNPYMVDVLQRCLQRQPTRRLSIPELLEHPMLRPELRARPASPAPAVVAAADEGVSLEALPHVIEQVCRAMGGARLDIAALRAEIARQQEAARARGPEVKLEIAPLVAAAMAAAQRPPAQPPAARLPPPSLTAPPLLIQPPLAPPPPPLAPAQAAALTVARPSLRPAAVGIAGGTCMSSPASKPGAKRGGGGSAVHNTSATELQEGLKKLQPVSRRTDELTSATQLQEGLKNLQPVSRRTDPRGASVAHGPGVADVGNLQRAVQQAMAARRGAAWRDDDATEEHTFS